MASQTKSRFEFGSLLRRPEFGALVGTIVVFVFFSIAGGAPFSDLGGWAAWLNVASELGIIVLPVSLIMIAGDLDLSVGSNIAAGAVTMAIISGFFDLPTILGVVAGLTVGTLVGIINGLIIVRTNLPSFVVTLATQFAVFGLVLGICKMLTGTVAVNVVADPGTKAIFGTLLFGNFETAIIIWAVLAIVVAWILFKTKYGNWIYAIGGDTVSAKSTGIPVSAVRVWLYAASGFASALVGIIQTSLYDSAQVGGGSSFVFNSIIAVVIGGVLLTGGYGSVIGVILGTMTFAIVSQGIFFTGWDSDWASLILGVLLLVAVLTNNTFRRLAFSTGKKKG